MCLLIPLGNTAAVQAVETNGVDFVEVGQGVVFLSQITDRPDGREVAFHRVTGLKSDDLRTRRIEPAQLCFQISHVVVFEDDLLGLGPAHGLDHGGMVETVRQNHTVLEVRRERAQRCQITDIARGKDQPGFLAVQIRQLTLQRHVQMVCARDIPRAANTCALLQRRIGHGLLNALILTHAEIIIGAPNGDLSRNARQGVAIHGFGVLAGDPLKVCEYAVSPFLVQGRQTVCEEGSVVHCGSLGFYD